MEVIYLFIGLTSKNLWQWYLFDSLRKIKIIHAITCYLELFSVFQSTITYHLSYSFLQDTLKNILIRKSKFKHYNICILRNEVFKKKNQFYSTHNRQIYGSIISRSHRHVFRFCDVLMIAALGFPFIFSPLVCRLMCLPAVIILAQNAFIGFTLHR